MKKSYLEIILRHELVAKGAGNFYPLDIFVEKWYNYMDVKLVACALS